ncbi:MAG: head-tail connector protein [Polymorphobacter sp.]
MTADKGAMAVSLAECKAYLRLARDDEDALLAGFIRTAMTLCEAFTGQWLIVRDCEQRLASSGEWQRILAAPVTAVTGVFVGGMALATAAYETDIDASGTGWVRVHDSSASDVQVQFRAGLGADWNGVPEPLRQGLVRLVVHLFSHRDAPDAGPPPAAVAAMWRPWRRMRLA